MKSRTRGIGTASFPRQSTAVIFLLFSVALLQVVAQDTQTLSRNVAVSSSPPGATVWMKVGTTLTCTNVQTPGTVEFKFRGGNDVKRIRLRKFGYKATNLDVRATDESVHAALGDPAPGSFVISPKAPAELKQLNEGLQQEFQRVLFGDPETFRCMPFELGFVRVIDDEGSVTLGVGIVLDRAFGGPAFRVASHLGKRDARRQKLAETALEAGIAELFARLGRIAAKFPNLKSVTVLCTYPSSETYLDTEKGQYVTTVAEVSPRNVYVYDLSTGRSEMKYMPALGLDVISAETEVTAVKDRDVEKVLKLVMPVADIPDSLDNKRVRDAVLAKGKISLAE